MRKLVEKRLVLATHNAGKLDEIRQLFQPFDIAVQSAKELALPEPAETETTFVGNARIKAHAAARAGPWPALADDSGITVDILGGAPGVYTADWAETPNGRDFVQAMRRTWDEICAQAAPPPYYAQFRCTLVLAWPDGQDHVVDGVMAGQVVWPMRGDNGHGYDPIFQPLGQDLTFAEMDQAQKNAISHRGAAFAKLIADCLT
jgi:XTP/dITP diphosphohydrolase